MSRGNPLSDELELSPALGDTRAYLYSLVPFWSSYSEPKGNSSKRDKLLRPREVTVCLIFKCWGGLTKTNHERAWLSTMLRRVRSSSSPLISSLLHPLCSVSLLRGFLPESTAPNARGVGARSPHRDQLSHPLAGAGFLLLTVGTRSHR